MKYTTFAFFFVCLSAIALLASDGNGQSLKEVTISLKLKNKTLDKAFDQIESATEFKFVYNPAEVRSFGMVSIDKKKITVEQALRELLPVGLTFQQSGSNILVVRKTTPAPKPAAKRASWTVTGKVTDDQSGEIPGATVRNKTTHTGVIADEKGTYRIQVSDETDTLIFSSLGYLPEEAIVGNRTVIDMSLVPNLEKLDQTVVIGYGTASRRTLTGSVSKISARTLEKQPTNDAMAALQGRVAGLQITNTSGLPGSNVNVQIRGVNSLKGGTSPLYIVDGVPFVSDPLNATFINRAGGPNSKLSVGSSYAVAGQALESPFKSINPADIASIEVLKDADATAIYGARGANGVILITTKRGKPGKPALDVDVYTGISQVTKFINMFNTPEYLAMRREAFKNDNATPTLVNDGMSTNYAPDLLSWDSTAYTNWQKKFISSAAHNTNVQASLSGGTEQTRFLINAGYRKQSTVYIGDYGLTQGSLRLNLDHNSANKRLTTTFSVAYSADENKLLADDPASYYDLPPNFPLYNANGSLNWQLGKNPMAAYLKTFTNSSNSLMGNVVLGYQLLPGLHLSSSFGYNKMQMNQLKLEPAASKDPSGERPTGSSDLANNSSSSLTIEPQMDYTLHLGKGKLDAMVGGTYLESTASSNWYSGSNYTDDNVLGNLAFAPILSVIPSGSRYRYLSAFSRLTYNWQSKYIFNLTLRRDGSSRFGPNRRYGNFGALGAAWVFSEEPLVKNHLPFLSFGKLRGSYGVTGNDKISDYQFYDTWRPVTTRYQTIGTMPTKLFNSDYGWETNRKLEAAMELGFLQDRLSFSIAYYRNRSGNQLIDYTLPSQSGFTGVNRNWNALIQNSGVEFELNAILLKSQSFTWSTSLNVSRQYNKLLSFPGLDSSAYRTQYIIGKSISNQWGYTFEGINPETGSQRYTDVNKDGQLTMEGDYSMLFSSLPAYYGGINNSFAYKGWQLDIFMNFRKLDNVVYRDYGVPGSFSNQDKTTLGRWQKPGDVANFPMYTQGYSQTYIENALYFIYSDRIYYNGSYLRLSNVSLSYDLPSKWLQYAKIQRLRFYVLAQNLLTLSNFPGPDPETGSGMPPLRVITGGFKITL